MTEVNCRLVAINTLTNTRTHSHTTYLSPPQVSFPLCHSDISREPGWRGNERQRPRMTSGLRQADTHTNGGKSIDLWPGKWAPSTHRVHENIDTLADHKWLSSSAVETLKTALLILNWWNGRKAITLTHCPWGCISAAAVLYNRVMLCVTLVYPNPS